MLEVTVDLCEALTPQSCSKLVIHLIKYILYHAEQIPVNYEALHTLLKKFKTHIDSATGENGCAPFNSLNKMKAEKFYKTIELLHSSCERIFEFIEHELKGSNEIRELVIVVGATIISPKKVIRIAIPSMPFLQCEKEHPAGRNLHSLCKHIVTSDTVFNYFRDKIGPTNVFIFLKLPSSQKPKTEWFLPKENFRLTRIGKHIKISLEQPKTNSCTCLELINSSNSSEINEVLPSYCEKDINEELYLWYQAKVTLKGLGESSHSALNLLVTSKS